MNADVWAVPGFVEVQPLGEGGQGRVVLARENNSGTPVAIKYITAEPGDGQAVERLREEAMMLSRVPHPHIAGLYRFVRNGPYAAIVMEAVDGVPLQKVLAANDHPLEPEAALTVLKGSLLGLSAAHAVGVIHRDYKPGNVIVRADGLSKLIDFGIATLAGVGTRSGTPAYMAPEQWEGQPAVPATDVYAATCVFFECVTGRRPYDLGGEALRAQHLLAPVPVGQVPEPLRPLIARGMAKDPTLRPPGAAAFVSELEAVARAAYGPDWEQRGVRGLALAAGALAGLFPLVALSMAPAGSGAAISQGAVAATGKGVLGTVGAKATLGVTAAAVVASGGAVAYTVAKKDPPPRPVAIQATLTSANLPYTGTRFRAERQIVTVSGLRNKPLQDRVNAALRAPVDRRQTQTREKVPAAFQSPPANGVAERTRADILMKGPKLISVSYFHLFSGHPTHSNRDIVNIDVTTGRTLAPRDLLHPSTSPQLTTRGLKHIPGGRLCTLSEESRPTPQDLGRTTFVAFAARHLEIYYIGKCTITAEFFLTVKVPYAEVTDLLTPQALRLLSATAVPSPSAS